MRFGSGVTAGPISVYYDLLEPLEGEPRGTLVMLHGGGCSGEAYLTTMDGRAGWAHYFLRQGFRVVLPDWPGCGRSGHVPEDRIGGESICQGLGQLLEELNQSVIVMTHSMSGVFGWRLLERHSELVAAVIGIAPSPPANVQPSGTVVARQGQEIEVQGNLSAAYKLDLSKSFAMTRALMEKKLYGVGQRFPKWTIDRLVASRQALHGRLLYERLNTNGAQLRIDRPEGFKDKPVLVVTGGDDPDHPREADAELVDWLREMGSNAQYLYLPDHGVAGNGHMMMSEDNSDEIARMVLQWIETHC